MPSSSHSNTGIISGNLQFTPKRIISIKDYTLKTIDYIEGVDYTVVDNTIYKKEGSNIPYLKDTVLSTKESPEGYNVVTNINNVSTDVMYMAGSWFTESALYYGNQIYVTYVYDVDDIKDNLNAYPSYNMDKLPKLASKLSKKEDIKITALGDSVLKGCSSSKTFNHEPFMDNFMELTRYNLAKLYDVNVSLTNLSRGGMTSNWAILQDQIDSVINTNADLLFVHFGINDLGSGVSFDTYINNMKYLIQNIRAKCPNMEIIFLTAFGVNPNIYNYKLIQQLFDRLENEVVDATDGVDSIDVFKVSKELYKTKKYFDMTANGINHVNDYASRVYLMSILSKL